MEFHYTKEDFSTPGPYEDILSIQNPFQREVATNQLAQYAKSVGVGITGFKRMMKLYIQSQESDRMVYLDHVTAFTGQKLELDSGEWTCDDFGVSRRGKFGEEIACPHPILPVERLVNIDTGGEKLKLAFCKGDRRWREVIAEKKVLASNTSILGLADSGIAVTSENSRALVKYISDLENLNFDLIPEKKSVARLGHIEGEGFSPYVEGLVFDGDLNFRSIFESIKSAGSRQAWLDLARSLRHGNVMARIVLAASFASPLVSPCGSLPFFVHLWGGESGTGKTVALMLAASVWASPEMGRYIQTFNSTVVGREKLAAFLNHLPLIVDELQLAKDSRGKLAFDVYALAEGVGRTRGNKNGGIDRTPTWSNCILTSGETPITNSSAGAGAVNRVIEIECLSSHKIIEDGHTTAGILRKNYGFAGREFVERLYQEGNTERAAELYKKHFRALSENDTTEKQAMAAAVILTADELATEWIFQDGRAITEQEISQFLASRAAVSSGRRGYDYFCDWAAQNANRLRGDVEMGDVYGTISGDQVCIIRSVFNRVAEEAGFSPAALLSYLKENGLIETRGRAMTCSRRVNGVRTECVCLKVDLGGENSLLEDEEF